MHTSSARSTPPSRVLLVEDDPAQARLLRRWLSHGGLFDVTHVSDGAMAARAVQGGDWSLLISDIELPGMDGLAFAREAKQAAPWTPILLMTAHGKMEYAAEAVRSQADDFVVKPLGRGDLMRRARSLIERARQPQRTPPCTVLAVGAHPCDVELGCGGALLRHRERGDDVAILTLVSDEPAESAGFAAVHSWGSQRLGEVSEGPATIELIEHLVKALKPDLLYLPSGHDQHPDRRNAHGAGMVAGRSVARVYGYQTPTSSGAFQPGRYIGIDEVFDQKARALEGAGRRQAHFQRASLRAVATYWGRFQGAGLVEPLEVIRERA